MDYTNAGNLTMGENGDVQPYANHPDDSFQSDTEAGGMELAIIGMAGHFPGARNVDEFWQNLCDGVESIRFFSDDEVLDAGVDQEQLSDPHYVKASGYLEDIDVFDAGFFGIYPREAALMDPQQRIFLEVAWEALENAGYNPDTYPGWIGLFAGTGMNTYLIYNLISNQEVMETVQGYQLTVNNDKDFLTTRVSYKLNLRGPSVDVQSACSTSLVATHLACQSLLSYACDIAMAGGVSVRVPQKTGYLYQEGGILSPDGHCRAFDADAHGTVSGNGAGIVVIKRLTDALRDGDTIYAVIKGSAINNDGSLKVGYTAPSVEGQAEVISIAQAVANVEPESISYIETHGTGTSLGDPIEVTALTQVFRTSTDKNQFCALGSVKTNIGHLDAAAGVASVIKTSLALKNKIIPPSINFTKPNPTIDFANSPFYVNDRLTHWPEGDGQRRAGISSFGIGGTNAHVILEEPDPAWEDHEHQDAETDTHLVMISARSEASLEKATDNLTSHLVDHPELSLEDTAYTLQIGRKSFNERRFVLAQNLSELISSLETRDPQKIFTGSLGNEKTLHNPSVVFMFSGQGAQYLNMGKELYAKFPVFRHHVNECADILQSVLNEDIRSLIFADQSIVDGQSSAGEAGYEEQNRASHALTQTSITQPALFVIEYSIANLLMHWGIIPQAMIGHSIGEYVAACLSGVFSLEAALQLVAERGRLMQSLPSGSMISIPLPEEEVRSYLDNDLSLAAVNAPALCVVSGSEPAIEHLVYRLANDGIEYRRLRTSHAFHSGMMDPILDEFERIVSRANPKAPQLPFISNLSGTWITPEQAQDPGYWSKHLRNTVRFSDGISELLKDSGWVLIETGPGQTLATLAKGVQAARSTLDADTSQDQPVLTTMRHPRNTQSDVDFLLTSLGKMWLAGISINWERFYEGQRRKRVPLPTYPFEKTRYWIEPDIHLNRMFDPGQQTGRATNRVRSTKRKELRKVSDVTRWFYLPSWKQSEVTSNPVEIATGNRWLLFSPVYDTYSQQEVQGSSKHNELAKEIQQSLISLSSSASDFSASVIVVKPGVSFRQIDSANFVLRPGVVEDYRAMIAVLKAGNLLPTHILHAWSLSENGATGDAISHNIDHGYQSLLKLVQALDFEGITSSIKLGLLTSGAQDVTGSDPLHAGQASIVALSRVVSQEYPNISSMSVDLEPGWEKSNLRAIGRLLVRELTTPINQHTVAYRGNRRWVLEFAPVPSDFSQTATFREGGVYLITGGLGRIGLVLAHYLAETGNVNLILVDRSKLVDRSDWAGWLNSHPFSDPTSQKIQSLLNLEAKGAQVLISQADVADSTSMRHVLHEAVARFGAINGVIHAAGLVGEAAVKPLRDTHLDDTLAQFSPKVTGLRVLIDLLKQPEFSRDLDFVFLQSSLSAVLGGLGLGAYAAANNTMDILAAGENREGKIAWISVNWDGWKFGEESSGTTIADLTMSPEEGIVAFERALGLANQHAGFRHLVISTADLDARISQWVRDITLVSSEQQDSEVATSSGKSKKSGVFPRPKLQTAYIAPRTELETEAVGIWQRILGIEPIGVFDDFFELGGHSLLATQLMTRLRDAFKVELPLRRMFESPTVAGIVALVEEARSEQIVVSRESAEIPKSDKGFADVFVKIDRNNELELSYGQMRLWFLDQFEPGSPLYNNFVALRISGELDVEALRFCLEQTVHRHESLRTTFQEVHGHPVQIIHEDLPVTIQELDLRSLTESQRQKQIEQVALEDSHKPFSLVDGPLLRLSLVRTAEMEHVLFLTMHHIVSDGWSVGVLVREVGALYSAFLSARADKSIDLHSILPALSFQYVDYAAWQRNWLRGNVLEEQLGYWKNQLAGIQNLELITDRPRPAVQSWSGASIWFELPEKVSTQLVALGNKEGVTLFMILTSALQLLLARYSGQEDISVGTPIANRTHAELEGLIGFFLNTLVLRTDLSGNPTFRELLSRVREVALGAYAHQDLPFEMLVEALQPVRDMSRAPLFQVIFDLQVEPLQSMNLPGLSISPLPIDSGTAKFDLALSMEEYQQSGNRRLKGYLNYNSDLFNAGTIQRMLDHFQILLESIIKDPDSPVMLLPLMSSQERQKIMIEWNDPKRQIPKMAFTEPAPFIHEVIRDQALRRPDAIALMQEAQALTYLDLEQQSNQLAAYLHQMGVGPGSIIGLCTDRSLEAVVALIAILKSGGAFLPLDPSYPRQRLEFMLKDSGAPVVISQAHLLDKNPDLAELFSIPGLRLILLDKDWTQISLTQVTESPIPGLNSDSLAYIIYTSGSTGQPKGVMINHGAIANHIRTMVQRFEIKPDEHVLQFASFNFDAGLEQIFTTLTSGARLILRGDDVWTPTEFHQKIAAYGLNVVNIPPAYWQPWVQYLADWEIKKTAPSGFPPAQLSSLRLVIIGGDVMLGDSVELWKQTSLANVRLLNAYGPTETTITATTYNITKDEQTEFGDEDIDSGKRPSSYARIPIGRPHTNRTAYILDSLGNPVPIGVPGELYLGGDCLARGYLNQPELTAQRFVNDHFAEKLRTVLGITPTGLEDDRLYKTGDMARFLPDGSIDFLGRGDQQVKIRGFRIELGEIDAILNSHPAVRECIVLLRPDGVTSENKLVAFYQPLDGEESDPVELYDFIKDRLPVYMVPSTFVAIDRIPLTPSGKVDRQALTNIPIGDNSRSIGRAAYVAPRTPLEEEIAALWIEVLGIKPDTDNELVGIYDNFFELGGHSLLATQIISRLRETYHVELPLRQLFENPTVSGISTIIAHSLVDEEAYEDIDELLTELEQMSDDDVKKLLAGDLEETQDE